MRFRQGAAEVLMNSMRALVAGGLCVLMVEQPVMAAAAVSKPVAASTQQIQGEQRVLHALNRFTFGPRPSDIAAGQAVGFEEGVEQQVKPSMIDGSAPGGRLGKFSAKEMEQGEGNGGDPGPGGLGPG